MQKIKNYLFAFLKDLRNVLKRPRLKNFFSSQKGKIILIIFFLLVALMTYYIFLLIMIKPSEIALFELKKSFSEEKICHEDCNFWRESREEIVVNDLKNKSPRLNKLVLKYWENPDLELNFKRELVKLNSQAYGKESAPDFLKNYINENNFNSDLAQDIISWFDLDISDLEILAVNLNNKYSLATSSLEKINILKTFAEIGNDANIDNYLFLLDSLEALEVKREVVKNLSMVREKNIYFSLSQLETIRSIILNIETDNSLRRDLVLLISDYYLIFPEESAALWLEVYNSENLDSISRLFSADNLNHLLKTNLVLPEVNPGDWDLYYNQ